MAKKRKEPELTVEYVAVETLLPYKNNARAHGDADVDAIMASIREFGFNDPIGVWKDIIVEGHGRLLAAKRMGLESVPVIRLDHMTDKQRKAYALAHNKTAELSGWDFDVLAAELQELSDIDMSAFGFQGGWWSPPPSWRRTTTRSCYQRSPRRRMAMRGC